MYALFWYLIGKRFLALKRRDEENNKILKIW